MDLENRPRNGEGHIMTSTEISNEFVWKRLQLSKAKLKGVTEIAALMAGFSVVATVELDIRSTTSGFLLTAFAVCTALLVSSAMLSIMIATCLLPHIEAVAKLNSIELISQSPHDLLVKYIDLAWVLANTVSIVLFIVDVILICWIKFPDVAAISITVIMIPVLMLLCIFSIIFYRQTIMTQVETSEKRYEELEALNRRISRNEFSKNVIEQELDSFEHLNNTISSLRVV